MLKETTDLRKRRQMDDRDILEGNILLHTPKNNSTLSEICGPHCFNCPGNTGRFFQTSFDICSNSQVTENDSRSLPIEAHLCAYTLPIEQHICDASAAMSYNTTDTQHVELEARSGIQRYRNTNEWPCQRGSDGKETEQNLYSTRTIGETNGA